MTEAVDAVLAKSGTMERLLLIRLTGSATTESPSTMSPRLFGSKDERETRSPLEAVVVVVIIEGDEGEKEERDAAGAGEATLITSSHDLFLRQSITLLVLPTTPAPPAAAAADPAGMDEDCLDARTAVPVIQCGGAGCCSCSCSPTGVPASLDVGHLSAFASERTADAAESLLLPPFSCLLVRRTERNPGSDISIALVNKPVCRGNQQQR